MDIRKCLPRKRPSEELDPDCDELDENMSDTELPDTVPILLPSSSGSQSSTKAAKKKVYKSKLTYIQTSVGIHISLGTLQ